jgi:hypothetical protein
MVVVALMNFAVAMATTSFTHMVMVTFLMAMTKVLIAAFQAVTLSVTSVPVAALQLIWARAKAAL